ncbi:MAG: hypothetical protein R2760_07260 [Chitinophagales bacterium]
MKGIKIILLLIIIIFFTYKLHNYINEPFFFRQINLNKNNYDIRFDTKDYDSIVIYRYAPFPKNLSIGDSILFYNSYNNIVLKTKNYQDALSDMDRGLIIYLKQNKPKFEIWYMNYRKYLIFFDTERVVIKNNKTFKVVINKDRKYQPAIRLIELKK